jgi:molybdate/tungstate transport system permease protein
MNPPGQIHSVKQHSRVTFIAFGALGGLLLASLILPIASLLLQANWVTWIAAWKEEGTRSALYVSLLTSITAMAIMLILGVPLGYLLARANLPARRFWIGLVFLPLVLPALAGGILLMQLFGPYGWIGGAFASHGHEVTNSYAGIILAQIFVASPFIIIAAYSAFERVDPQLEMAAAILGDSQFQILWRVSLPLAWPGIAAGATLAWIRTLGEFGATLLVAYNPHTLPIYLWVKFQSDGLHGALPLALLLVLLAVVAVAVSTLLSRISGQTGTAMLE